MNDSRKKNTQAGPDNIPAGRFVFDPRPAPAGAPDTDPPAEWRNDLFRSYGEIEDTPEDYEL